jgi:hypothetical protein
MKKILLLPIFVIAVLLPWGVAGQTTPSELPKDTRHVFPNEPELDGVTIITACTSTTTDSPGCRCATVSTRGFSKVWLTALYTKGAATRVDLEVYTSHVSGAWGTLQSGPSTGLPSLQMSNHDPWWDTSGVSGTVGWSTGFDVVAPMMRFCWVGTGANSSDLLDLYVAKF